MELRQLQEFLAVMECGSLGDAARRLKTRQPNLTKSIKALEKAVGGALFMRSPQGMKPTALARILETRARVISGEIGRAEREVGEHVHAQRGKVVIGTGPLFSHAIFRGVVASFRQVHPKVEISVRYGQTRDIFPLVKTGDIDFALHSPPEWLGEEELDSETLLKGLTVAVATNAGNPLLAKRRLSLKDLSAAAWMLPTAPDYMRRRLDATFTAAGLPVIKPAVECDSVLLMKSLLRDGNLLGIFTDMVIEEELERKLVKMLRVPQLIWKFDFSAIYRRGVPLPPAAQLLLGEIRQACAKRRLR